MNVNYLSVTASQGPAAGSTLLDNLLGYWKLDETSGSTSNDEVGSNDATLGAGCSFTSSGKINYGVDFTSSTTGVITVPQAVLMNQLTDKFTLSMWIKFDTLSSGLAYECDLFSSLSSGATAIEILMASNDRIIAYIRSSGGIWHSCNGPIITDTTNFMHFVYMVNGQGYPPKIYINNVDVTSSSANLSFNIPNIDNANGSFIGNLNNVGSQHAIDGRIDELAFWSRDLTSGEMAELYNSGSGNQYPF